jgi:acyl-CoA thioester hydrolase
MCTPFRIRIAQIGLAVHYCLALPDIQLLSGIILATLLPCGYRIAYAAVSCPEGVKGEAERMLNGEITIRVRYAETDRMGLLHHANYLVYFEQGRTELLRSDGLTYKDVEDQGFFLVLTKIEVRYRNPAHYDDLLTLRTSVVRKTSVRIDHRYELVRDGTLVAEGTSTLACIDRAGRVQALPESLRQA